MFKEIRLKFQSDKTQLILKINFTEIMDRRIERKFSIKNYNQYNYKGK